jgi:hypothetical protein
MKSNPKVVRKVTVSMVEPTKDQIEEIKVYLDEIGMPHTEDYLNN